MKEETREKRQNEKKAGAIALAYSSALNSSGFGVVSCSHFVATFGKVDNFKTWKEMETEGRQKAGDLIFESLELYEVPNVYTFEKQETRKETDQKLKDLAMVIGFESIQRSQVGEGMQVAQVVDDFKILRILETYKNGIKVVKVVAVGDFVGCVVFDYQQEKEDRDLAIFLLKVGDRYVLKISHNGETYTGHRIKKPKPKTFKNGGDIFEILDQHYTGHGWQRLKVRRPGDPLYKAIDLFIWKGVENSEQFKNKKQKGSIWFFLYHGDEIEQATKMRKGWKNFKTPKQEEQEREKAKEMREQTKQTRNEGKENNGKK